MFERMKTGWNLGLQSFGVLRHDKELVLFPLMSGAACLLVLTSFALPLWNTPYFRQFFDAQDHQAPQNPIVYVILFAFYVINYFVIVFFNAALVSCALKRLAGGDPTVGYGIKQAMARLPQIAAWAVVSGTVGLVLKMIESKSDKIGQLIASLVGAGWAIATYFVVPILVVEQVGPWQAFKRSTSLIRHTWGEALVGNMGTGLLVMLGMIPGFLSFVIGIVLFAANQPIAGGIFFGLGAIWIALVSLVGTAVQSILLTALYLYAADGTTPPQFDENLLKQAFGSKKAKAI
jgi:hypothetical protein